MDIIYNLILDLILNILPKNIVRKVIRKYNFGFLGHARGYEDFYKKLPFTRFLPKKALNFVSLYLWPLRIARIKGLRDQENNKLIGIMVVCPMTADLMLKYRKSASKRLIQSAKFIEKLGAEIIGLGGMSSSMTQGGRMIQSQIKSIITTGHMFTTITICQHVQNCMAFFFKNSKNLDVSIVGAGGSIGTNVVKYLLSQYRFKRVRLIDLERKKAYINELYENLKILYPDQSILQSYSVESVSNSKVIISATSSPETILKSEMISPGTIIIDDAQPKDVEERLYERDDVLILEGGVVTTPSVYCDYDTELKDEGDVYSCLGEVLILSHLGYKGASLLNPINWNFLKYIEAVANQIGFKAGSMQNKYKKYTLEELENFRVLITQQDKNG